MLLDLYTAGMATPRSTRDPLFLGRWFQDEVIIVAVRWYLTYPLTRRLKQNPAAVRTVEFGFFVVVVVGHSRGGAYKRSAAATRGSRRLSPELRVPTPKHAFEFVVQDLGPGLQEQMGTFRRPVHLLFLHEPAAHHLIDR